MNIAGNLATIQSRIADACRRSGRNPDEVTLVAVTKTVTRAEVDELYRLGVRDFGENRVFDGAERLKHLADTDVRCHMIGHLQRNKAREALQAGFSCIHSVESPKLLAVLDKEAAGLGLVPDVMLEINVSGEESKYGISPDQAGKLAEQALALANIRLVGVMTMAPLEAEPEQTRPVFQGLRRCKEDLETQFSIALPHLSMGMTNDFEIAVEEGATLVRIGTALFR
ncbi:MAG: YggS family pyridoxal phosphate-dependent enzyme [Planctomycetes bacterium]|nr:YggS family pyridoxal phosphate-dependent enzyme [Planctomycetota bacterium]